ncbi:hypothetical protein Tco_0170385, partial [Tanacetum coccineum]
IPEPDVALELGKSISLTEAAEEEAARQVHVTHARIMIESVLKPAKRRPSGIAFRDTSSVSNKMSSDPSQKLKGVQTLTPEEHIAADIMKSLKERVLDKSIVIPATSSEGTSTKPGVPDEEGSEYSEKDDDENIDWVDTDEEEEKDDDDDDKSIDLEKTDDEETVQDDDEETNDELVYADG